METREQTNLLNQLRHDAEVIAAAFQLRYRAIVAEHPRVKSRYGACYSDGLIKIRLRHATTGKPLKYSSMIDTLCHELAHLRHFNHGPEFKSFFLRLLSWARKQGIYRPRTMPQPLPTSNIFGPVSHRLASADRCAHDHVSPRLYQGPSTKNGVPVFGNGISAGSSQWDSEGFLPWEINLQKNREKSVPPKPIILSSEVNDLDNRGEETASKQNEDEKKTLKKPPEQLSLF